MLERIREKGREEGLLKGEQIGEQRGKLEKALETARNMKNLGLSMEVIIKSVGLSEAELRENGIF
jgi:predicted transposase/invertase (TIGR01784 family)